MNILPLQKRTEKIYQKIGTLTRDITRLHDQVGNAIPLNPNLIEEVDTFLEKMRAALSELREGIDSPEVIFAISGTTSAGKSTLVNMLLGDKVMPYAVQEMSAGSVEIIHHKENRALRIMDTAGATWESGYFPDLSACEIRERLKTIMTTYRDARRDNPKMTMKAPEFVVEWQCFLAKDLQALGLPEETKIRILDLPGLKYIGDESNTKVIEKKVKNAFCIVAYNSLETDEHKQKDLLQQVTNQVKSFGGGPARMMFVLNKIDAFLKDEDPEKSRKDFQERICAGIQAALAKDLPEYQSDIEQIVPVSLSSEPALFAIQAMKGDQEALQKMTGGAYQLLILKELQKLQLNPWTMSSWAKKDIETLCRSMFQASLYDHFLGSFKKQIRTHLPSLILPPLVKNVIDPVKEAFAILDMSITTFQHNKEEDLQEKKRYFEQVFVDLQNQLKEKQAHFVEPYRKVLDEKDFSDKIGGVVKDSCAYIYEHNPEFEESLNNQAIVFNNINFLLVRKPLRMLQEYMFDFLDSRRDGGDQPENYAIEALESYSSLRESLVYLSAGPYGKHFDTEEGVRFEGDDAEQVKKHLAEFTEALNTTVFELLRESFILERKRFNEAFSFLLNAYVENINNSIVQNDINNLKNIFATDVHVSDLHYPHTKIKKAYEDWSESRTRKTGTRTEVVGYERSIWTLFLIRHEITKDVDVFEKYNVQGITVRSLEDLFEQTIIKSPALEAITTVISIWLRTNLDYFSGNLERDLKHAKTRCMSIIDDRLNNFEQLTEKELQKVDALMPSINNLSEDLDACRWSVLAQEEQK